MAIAESVLEIDPPEPMVYEWFTYEGQPFSSSTGHVLLVSEVLELIEPEVLLYFFAQNPKKARDFSIDRIDQLVDDFDAIEAAFFGERSKAESRIEFATRVYPFLVDEIDSSRIRLPYTFAAVLSMTDDLSLQREIAEREGHLPPSISDEIAKQALNRVSLAGRWAMRTDNRFNYQLHRNFIPSVSLSAEVEEALETVADVVEAGGDGEEIQGAIFEVARERELDVGEVFEAGYRLLFDEPTGPKLGPFLAELDRDFVVSRLRREA